MTYVMTLSIKTLTFKLNHYNDLKLVTILTLDDRGPSDPKNETNPLGGSEDLTDGDGFNDGPVDYEIPENKIS